MFLQINTMEHKLNEVFKTLKSGNLDWSGTRRSKYLVDCSMPEPLIRAGGILKQAAAIVNAEVSSLYISSDVVRSRSQSIRRNSRSRQRSRRRETKRPFPPSSLANRLRNTVPHERKRSDFQSSNKSTWR
jgi:hypothetical protein